MNNVLFYKDTDLAWTAGLIDGEGCIRIHRQLTNPHRVTPGYALEIKVKMTHKPTIERLREIFGVGSITKEMPGKLNKKIAWKWNLAGKDAAGVLCLVLQWLVTKKQEARIGIRFYDMNIRRKTVTHGVPVPLGKAREKFYQMMRAEKRSEFVI